jgi:hypothetical protein
MRASLVTMGWGECRDHGNDRAGSKSRRRRPLLLATNHGENFKNFFELDLDVCCERRDGYRATPRRERIFFRTVSQRSTMG